MNIQGLIPSEGIASLSKSQSPHLRQGTLMSRYGSGKQIPIGEEAQVAESNPASIKNIPQGSEHMDLESGFVGTISKKTEKTKGILGSRGKSFKSIGENPISQQLVSPPNQMSLSKNILSNKLMKKTPQVVNNQKTSSNPKLVRVKLDSSTSSHFGQSAEGLNPSKPITIGTTSTQQLLGVKSIREMEQH